MTALAYAKPVGPHPVGVRDGEVLDTAYPVLRPEDAQGRRLMVRVWYPAEADGERRPYLSNGEVQVLTWFAELNGSPPLWSAQLAGVSTHSVENAQPLAGTFPTVLFSHGASSWVSQNTPLMEDLASHGYIVWSVAHPGEACGVHYPNGELVRGDTQFHTSFVSLMSNPRYMEKLLGDVGTRLAVTPDFLDDSGMGPWARRWVDDLRAVIDALESHSVTGDCVDLVDASDLSLLGLGGMSFGAAAAVSAAHRDERVKAVVNLDGGQHLSDLLDADIRLPLLHLATDVPAQLSAMGLADVATLDANEFFYEPVATVGTRSDVQRLRIEGLTHLELTDLVLLPADERAAVLPAGGQADSQRVLDLLNAFIRGHFDKELLGRGLDFPATQLQAFPEVSRIDLSPVREWAASRAE